MAAAAEAPARPHAPVLLAPLLAAAAPVSGVWLDATLGAGGTARALLEAGAERIIGLDRDPQALALHAGGDGRIVPVEARFSALDVHAPAPLAGVVLDLGVSSMQLDEAGRGFSFAADGPLDMRMGRGGTTAAEIVNTASEERLADILHHFGEERAARRIARAIVAARGRGSVTTTGELARVVAGVLPRQRPGQVHPATRSFQALRIAVNDELGELVAGLEAAERALAPGGRLVVIAFHSLEDRIVKRFLTLRSGGGGRGSRHGPEQAPPAPRFRLTRRRPITPEPAEIAANPRARSARMRVATRTDAPAGPVDRSRLGLPPTTGEV